MNFRPVVAFTVLTVLLSCNDDESDAYVPIAKYPNIAAAFGNKINLDHLDNYANQAVPAYITRDNTVGNVITDKGATLGRILFYDKNLSANNTVSCSTCHIQSHAFSDPNITSTGANGNTDRHSMRLVNARYGVEKKFFWNERAASLELQTTEPIQNHAEMGYSGLDGSPTLNDLVVKLQDFGYYQELFQFVYGDAEVTTVRIQNALAQFIRSITSFDSKYDLARSLAPNDDMPFPSFTMQENMGKDLFFQQTVFEEGVRISGGVECAICHQGPEFSIDPETKNNGIINVINNPNTKDLKNTRAPSLRNLAKKDGTLNGPFMHTGEFNTLEEVIGHYNSIEMVPENINLDPRLRPGGMPQQLNLTAEEIAALKAFLLTLSGSDVYTDPKWSNPF